MKLVREEFLSQKKLDFLQTKLTVYAIELTKGTSGMAMLEFFLHPLEKTDQQVQNRELSSKYVVTNWFKKLQDVKEDQPEVVCTVEITQPLSQSNNLFDVE